jgi:predicted  nucleic acid-binding Zn-ribbon protein
MNHGGISLTEPKFNVIDLVELQLIENTISARSSEIERIKNNKELVSTQDEFEKVKEKLNKINGVYAEMESKRKKLEDTVGMQNEKIKNDENKLFSGTITSTKELENYQQEVIFLKQKNSEMEDQILELMIELEEISERVKLAQVEKDKAEANVNRIKSEINEKTEVLKNIVEGVKKRREDVTSRIPDDYLKKYNELKGKKGGIAVAVLKDNFCNVCNMQIPAIAAEEIEDIDKIYRCPLCGRMAVIYREEIMQIKKELES